MPKTYSVCIGAVICLALLLSGCGKKMSSTLPPVDPEVKQQTPESTPVTTTPVPADTTPTGWVIKDKINVRSQPSTSAAVVTQLTRGTKIRLVNYADNWWKVLLEDGRTAYIYEPLLTREPYVDPWTRFKMEATRANPILEIVVGVTGLDTEIPSAALTVAPRWNDLPPSDRTAVAEAAFNFWSECLTKCGYDPLRSQIVLHSYAGAELGRVSLVGGKPEVRLN